MNNNILQLEGVCKTFDGFALKDITFTVPEGFVMGLIGHNGAGKTTTINLILNLLDRDAGAITLLDRETRGNVDLRDNVGVVSDTSFFVEDWTAQDVRKVMRSFHKRWSDDVYTEYLRRFELPRDRKIKDFSRGMQTKLMLSAAMSHDARLLILDEPTSGMDPLARDELLSMLLEYIEDGRRSVLFSTHITTDLERIADFVTFINRGAVFFTGPTEEFLESFRVIKGGEEDLTPAIRKQAIGLHEHRTGFDALVRADAVPDPDACVLDPVSIDDIMVYVGKEGR